MSPWKTTTAILLLLTAGVRPQLLDFLGYPPTNQNTRYGNEFTTRRTKIDTIRTLQGVDSQITWKNTTISFVYEGLEEREGATQTKEKRRKQTIVISPPIYDINFVTSTPKTVTKTAKVTNSNLRRLNSDVNRSGENIRLIQDDNEDSREDYLSSGYSRPSNLVRGNTRLTEDRNENTIRRAPLSGLDVDVSKTRIPSDWYDRPINNIHDVYYTERPYYETTKGYNYNNKNPYKNDYYFTTKNPYFDRPGVRPLVPENRPPITNRPATRRPIIPSTISTIRPRPVTNKPTVKPYIVNPFPTDAGALVFPHEDEPPEIIKGPDEDSMTEAEKRRYIDIAEKMCDKYKALSTKRIQAIPLLPSPEPVQVNVSDCAPTTIPLVVGGKVVTINEFPHMALLGWIKLEGAGYSWKCGGSLISDQYILTAAHCSYQERDNTVISGPPRVVQLGSSYLDDAGAVVSHPNGPPRVVQLGSSYLDDPGALVARVGAVVRHPKYKFPKSYYDVALLKLVRKVTFSDVIKPACLGVAPPAGAPIIATGWGRTELGGDQSLELRSVSLPVWDIGRCHEVLGTSRKMPDGPTAASQLCAGEERGGKDTCQGDSGGPAQIQDGCAWRVVAVTSLGRSCGAANTPGLYALVHRAFISAQVFGNYNRNNRDADDSQQQNKNGQTTERSYDNTYDKQATESNNQNYGRNGHKTDQGNEYTNNHRTTHSTGSNNQPSYPNNNREPAYSENNNRGRNDYGNNNRDQNGYGNNNRAQNDYGNNQNYPNIDWNGQPNYRPNNNPYSSIYSNQPDYANNRRRNGYWAPSFDNNRRQIHGGYGGGRIWY